MPNPEILENIFVTMGLEFLKKNMEKYTLYVRI